MIVSDPLQPPIKLKGDTCAALDHTFNIVLIAGKDVEPFISVLKRPIKGVCKPKDMLIQELSTFNTHSQETFVYRLH